MGFTPLCDFVSVVVDEFRTLPIKRAGLRAGLFLLTLLARLALSFCALQDGRGRLSLRGSC